MSKSDATQARKNPNYHEDVIADLNREHDLDATAPDDDEMADDNITIDTTNYVNAAVQKVFHSLTFCPLFLNVHL
jgi:hypothetical protein